MHRDQRLPIGVADVPGHVAGHAGVWCARASLKGGAAQPRHAPAQETKGDGGQPRPAVAEAALPRLPAATPSRPERVRPRLTFVGERFGSLVAVECVGTDARGNSRWRFRCSCGATFVARASRVRRWLRRTGAASCAACWRARWFAQLNALVAEREAARAAAGGLA